MMVVVNFRKGRIGSMLEVENIVKVYGDATISTTALNGVSFSVQKGEFIAIMGPSGSGKTTLLNMLSGIDLPTSGTVKINGKEFGQMDSEDLAVFRRQEIGFVFQSFQLIDSLTVKENILLPMILEKQSVEMMEGKIGQLATLFEIDDILDRYPYQVSGGQGQRTAVARALVNEPSIVFADEPTGNLDSKTSALIMECFQRIVTNLTTTVLLVTHDVFAASYCDKVIFIKDGLLHSFIVRKGSQQEFLHQIMDNLRVVGGKIHAL